MAMTNTNMTPTKVPPTAEQLKAAVEQVTAHDDEAQLLANTAQELKDQISAEQDAVDAKLKANPETEVNISDLTEEDAYNYAVPINAGAQYNPDVLKVVLKDKNYVCRWGNTNPVRQTMLKAQGFRPITLDEVENTTTLEMFEDSQQHLVYADLMAMKIPKTIYFAALRRNHMKSLYATNDKKAREAGAAFASSDLNSQLQGSQRNYLAQQQEAGKKPIYSPNIGV